MAVRGFKTVSKLDFGQNKVFSFQQVLWLLNFGLGFLHIDFFYRHLKTQFPVNQVLVFVGDRAGPKTQPYLVFGQLSGPCSHEAQVLH
jgi:hypothetical protein